MPFSDLFKELSTVAPKSSSSSSAILTFVGPRHDIVSVFAANGTELAQFPVTTSKHSKPNITIARPGHNAPSTVSFSSLSDTVTCSVHNQEMKMRQSMTSSSGSIKIETPFGVLKWRPSMSGSSYTLVDAGGICLAKMKVSTFSNVPTTEVFVQGDEFLYDLIMVSGVALWKFQEKQAKMAADVIDAVAGV